MQLAALTVIRTAAVAVVQPDQVTVELVLAVFELVLVLDCFVDP